MNEELLKKSISIGQGGSYIDERKKLHELVKDKVVLEIGCMLGQTTIVLCDSAKEVWCVDVFDDTHEIENTPSREHYEGVKNIIGEKVYNRFRENVKDCKNLTINISTTKEFSELVGDESFDVIFVDGDHSHDGCRDDIINFRDKLKTNGLMIFHDTNNETWGEGINRAIDKHLPKNFELIETYLSLKIFQKN
jgi:SAM-dependent methyltransferase